MSGENCAPQERMMGSNQQIQRSTEGGERCLSVDRKDTKGKKHTAEANAACCTSDMRRLRRLMKINMSKGAEAGEEASLSR